MRAVVVVAGLAALASVVAVGCDGCGGPAASDPRSVRADVRTISELLARDRTVAILEEVDRAVEDRLPVRGAELLDRAALPAARALRDGLEHASLTTPEGERMRSKAVGIAVRRIRSLEKWRDALARGTVEDMELLDAMRDQHRVERDLAALDDELAKMRPAGRERR